MPWHRTLDAQGVYYVLTGAWPLVSYRSFEAVLGEKVDDWLVRLVALLAVSIGTALLLRQPRAMPTRHVVVLAAGAAVAFGAIDVVYALSGRISPLYLLDALAEIAFIAGMVRWLARQRQATPAAPPDIDPLRRPW